MVRDVQDQVGMVLGADPEPGSSTAIRDSIVVVDANRTDARVLLFEAVDGVGRFVALGEADATALPPVGDPTVGIRAALRALEAETGRRFLEGERLISPQRPNGEGADAYYLTGLPVPENRAALVSIGGDRLRTEIIGAVRRTPTVLADATVDLSDAGPRFSSTLIGNWLRAVRPQTIILAREGGAAEDWDLTVEAVTDIAKDGLLTYGIVVADDASQQKAAQSLGQYLELSGIDPSEYQANEIGLALETEFRDQYGRRLTEESSLSRLTEAAFVDRVLSMQAVAAFLHRRMNRSILSILPGDGTLLHYVGHRKTSTLYRTDIDLGLGARMLLRIPTDRIARWLPFRMSDEEITQWLLNRNIRPQTQPESTDDLLVAAAVQRETWTDLIRQIGLGSELPVDLITIGPGNLFGSDVGLTVLAILDAVRPKSVDGLVTIAADAEGMITAAGTIASEDTVFARDVIEQDFLTSLATCVLIEGQAEEGDLAVRGVITLAGGESRHFSVPYGTLLRLPLDEGQSASLELTPEPGFAIGSRQPGQAAHFADDRAIFGGRLGVVIDARGRPVQLPDEPEARVARLRTWLEDLGSKAE